MLPNTESASNGIMAHKVPLDPDVKDLLDALDAAGAQYVIIGAHAMGAHGIIRATGDFDLLVRPTADNSTRVHRALIEFGVRNIQTREEEVA
jgi:hypothetical protein